MHSTFVILQKPLLLKAVSSVSQQTADLLNTTAKLWKCVLASLQSLGEGILPGRNERDRRTRRVLHQNPSLQFRWI